MHYWQVFVVKVTQGKSVDILARNIEASTQDFPEDGLS